MADKRISQLVDRGTVANNDVVPIVVSGATTTNKATISSIQTFMQGNLDLGVTSVGITIGSAGTNVNVTGSPITSSGNITINLPTASAANRGLLNSADWNTFNSKLDSVGLTMPSAFTVSNSPLTANGTISVAGAGTVSQYIRGDGSLADFPSGGGGGSSVNYYLNGSVSQGTIGGIAYKEINKTPVLGAGTDFVAIADGYLASFITDAGDPALLEIPAGNWDFETYFSASSSGGSPSFYIELYKVNSGGTATLIASNSATPELIAFGTTITPYFSALAVPTTALAITDRLALRYYVARSGRTITLHTENSHLCQIITTFTTGLTALNGLTAQVQNFTTGTSGTDFAISSTSATHTFNLPDASASARGVVTTGTQTFAGYKIFNGTIGVNNDIQLATNGTALNTFIKNINAVGLTSIGSNGFGFNNSNNIYFSGSSKGGGIFAFSNTGNQTYTLQDASGTLAFTSQIPSVAGVYLPLAGGTMTGAIVGTTSTFTNSGAGIGVGVTNSGSGDGVKITHSAGKAFNIQSSGAGFGVIINNETASTSAPFTIQKQGTNKVAFTDAGAADFSSSVTASSFVKSSGTSAQFLMADGSVNTSVLPSGAYLPLTGGTLTGALSGTSATFSSSVTANSYVQGTCLSSTNGDGVRVYATTATAGGSQPAIGYYTLGGSKRFTNQLDVSSDTWAVTGTTGTNYLLITQAGAATFSSSVTATGNVTARSRLAITKADNTLGASIDYDDAINQCYIYNHKTGGYFSVYTNALERLQIASTGAATFSSSVTAQGGKSQFVASGGASAGAGISLNTGLSGADRRNWFIGTEESVAGDFTIKCSTAAGGVGGSGDTRLAILNNGNVGIGTASPSKRLDIFDNNATGTDDILRVYQDLSGNHAFFRSQRNGGANMVMGATRSNVDGNIPANSSIIWNYSNSDMVFGTNTTERMRITSGGEVLVGTQTTDVNTVGCQLRPFGLGIFVRSGAAALQLNRTSSDGILASFRTSDVERGSISISGSVTSYNVTSDYRLKEDFQEIKGLEKVGAIKVYDYKWKLDEKRMDGVLAHELAEVLPYAVFGEKDEVDEDGNDRMQSVDYSKIVPIMIKAIQELKTEIDSLKNQIK